MLPSVVFLDHVWMSGVAFSDDSCGSSLCEATRGRSICVYDNVRDRVKLHYSGVGCFLANLWVIIFVSYTREL